MTQIPPQGITPKDLDRIKLSDGKGNVVAQAGMMVTLYLEDPHEKKLRLAVGQCIEEYLALVRPHLKRFGSEKLGIKRFDRDALAPLVEHIEPLDEHDFFEFITTGSQKDAESSAYNLKTLLDFKASYKKIGYLSATFPLEFLEQQPGGFFQKWVHTWCKRLSPYHGYAGLGLIRSVGIGEAKSIGPLLYPLLSRFPGFEIDMPHSHSIYCVDGIKGVNWLTIISDTFLQKLEGHAALQSQLDEEFPFYDYPGGTMIQAGPYPQIGDLEQNNVPKHYQRLYRLVKPVQSEKLKTVMSNLPKGINVDEFNKQWLRRFE